MNKNRNKRISFLFTPKQAQILQQLKDKTGLKGAQIMRAAILLLAKQHNISHTDLNDIRKPGRPRIPYE